MNTRVTPFLMFEGRAEEAMSFYLALFDDGTIDQVERYGSGEPGPEGTIKVASFRIAGQSVKCIDSPVRHGFTFTPAMSLFVDCSCEEQLSKLFSALAEGGSVLMPLGAYGFSTRFGWVNDRFGVSWQINLP